MAQQHSPLPWRVDPRYCRDLQDANEVELATALDTSDEGDEFIIVGPCPSAEQADANAAFIVRACNAHYQMLEALNVTRRSASWLQITKETRDLIELAIAAAEAEGR